MRTLFIVMVLALAVSAFAQQDLCSDTDDGGSKKSDVDSFKEKGEVTYGITPTSDTCVTSMKDGVSTSSSPYLREYFCQDDHRNSDVYDCVDLGFEKCEDGACVGNVTPSQQQQTTVQQSDCGNKIVEKDKGENCDPPGSICFGRTTAEYGSCGSNCQCQIAKAALESAKDEPARCGDGYLHPDEDCEEDDDCPDNYVCSSCSCVKQLTAEEIAAMKSSAVVEEKEEVKEIAEEVEEKYKAPEVKTNLTDEDFEPKNFSDSPGIKATSGIAGFFKKIFGWIAALFS